MSSIFDFSRFYRLFKSHWVENRRSYIWFAAIAVVIDLIIISIVFMADQGRHGGSFYFDSQVVWFTTGFFITGIIFATRYWSSLSYPGACLIALMRPASIFEKWLLALVWMLFIFPITYTIFYILLHWPSVQLAEWLYQSRANYVTDSKWSGSDFNLYLPLMMYGDDVQSENVKMNEFRLLEFFVFMIWSSLLGFCAGFKVFFKKASTLKMVVLGFIICVIAIALSAILDINFFKFGTYWTGHKMAGWQEDNFAEILSNIILIGIPSLLWAALYFHLQEREV